jgi:hypothetical protein
MVDKTYAELNLPSDQVFVKEHAPADGRQR